MADSIVIKNLYYQNLFENFSLTVEKNRFVSISGPNNCGKTTLMRILSREIIVEGDIQVEGEAINRYPIDEYSQLVECIIPREFIPEESTLIEEMLLYNMDKKEIEKILRKLKIKGKRNTSFQDLSTKDQILYQIACSLSKHPKIVLIDGISSYLEEKERIEVLTFLKEYQSSQDLTILYTTLNLEESLLTDYLYILDERKVVLHGIPSKILERDNIINKIGLKLPFMMDLSVKLRDYELIKEVELDMNRMVEALWK